MAGNKALKKFMESKIPKKGKGKPMREIKIYKEPNTNSEIIGKITPGTDISWIYKSICDDREWMRCDGKQQFGYIIGHDKDGTCNFDVGDICEVAEKKPDIYVKNDKLTDEDIKIGEDALKAILEEDDFKTGKDKNNASDTSTQEDNSLDNIASNFNSHLDLDDKYDNFYINDNNLKDINFKIENALQVRKADFLFNEILTESENEKPKIIEINKNEEDKKDKKEEESNVKRAISSIIDLLPLVGQIKGGIEAIAGIDLITNEQLSPRERLMNALNLIPGMNCVNKAGKISRSLTVYNKASKTSKAAKTSKVAKKIAKNNGKKDKKSEKEDIKDKKEDSLPSHENYAREGANCHQAYRDAKRYYNIPKSDIPKIKPNVDRQGRIQPGKIFEHKDVNGKTVSLRNDCEGHKYLDGGKDQPPHINGPDGKHFYYDIDKQNIKK